MFILKYIFRYLLNKFNFNINLLNYLRCRIFFSFLTSFALSLILGIYFIIFFKKDSKIIHNTILFLHKKKNNIPTMGGLLIIISILISVLIWSNLINPYIWYVILIIIGYGTIGFIDDYSKITYKPYKGLNFFWKYTFQSIIGLIISFIIFITNKNKKILIIPGYKKTFQLGLLNIILSYFVILGTSNAVNLTDGLDGLAIIPIILVSTSMLLLSYISGNKNLSNYLNIPYNNFVQELTTICASIFGASLGFLWHNTYPAQVFMGDTGSLSLGGALAVIAILLNQELLLFIIGGIFVIETLSVIIQIIYLKILGKRIFLMSPIHHHYELKGYSEPLIVVRVWIISLVLFLIGLFLLQIR